MTTEERLSRLEERMAKAEEAIRHAEELFAKFTAGPGRKIAAMLGITP